ncbi:MAG: 2-hydroxyacid dehydrogenase [Acidobacteriaceae bacterium]
MVRVGIQETVAQELLSDFPDGVEVVRLPRLPARDYAVDFWVPPFNAKAVAAVLPHLQGLKVVQSLMAGVDWLLPCLPAGLTVCDGRGIHDVPTSEWVLAAILSSLKRFPHYRDNQNAGQWRGQVAFGGGFRAHEEKREDAAKAQSLQAGQLIVLSDELFGKTVLIVGHGSVGAAIEARLRAFDAKILRVARNAREGVSSIADLPELLPLADVVVLIVPLTQSTRGMFGAAWMARMKPGALLVNAARGPVVVTDDLVAALREGRIHAAVDVTDPEPLPPDHPLWSAPNCLITPHVGGSTAAFIGRAYALVARQLQHCVKGEPLENIVGDAGY